ncbi:hypothetical protein RHMOL_Rhmol01G0311800 [Rhododendron molle]|uniref:Uncharacterized protein n=1 Tax=Rhododendron molle TaxID=49168 RepID=A0ACC0Q9K6_RHOML|nr:hypothetical protein RHMOL_Rhmol01G0311800 [Rhododendron molle]
MQFSFIQTLIAFICAGEFDDVLDSSSSKHLSDPLVKIHLMYCNVKSLTSSVQSNGSMLLENRQELLDIENLTLQTPSSNATLIRDLSLKINEKDHLLVTGPSESGKTSLLRAIAGLWNTGRGEIRFYVKDTRDPQPPLSPDVAPLDGSSSHDIQGNLGRFGCRNSRGVFFLPERPYMVLGTLRQQLLYPTWTEDLAVVLDQGLEVDLVADIQKYLEDLISSGLRQRLISLIKELNREEPAGLGGRHSERYVLDSRGALVERQAVVCRERLILGHCLVLSILVVRASPASLPTRSPRHSSPSAFAPPSSPPLTPSTTTPSLFGIVVVIPEQIRKLHTTRSHEFLGLKTTDNAGLSEESDFVIGVIDAGFWLSPPFPQPTNNWYEWAGADILVMNSKSDSTASNC